MHQKPYSSHGDYTSCGRGKGRKFSAKVEPQIILSINADYDFADREGQKGPEAYTGLRHHTDKSYIISLPDFQQALTMPAPSSTATQQV